MKSGLKILTLLIVVSWFFSGCGTKKTKTKEEITEKADTVITRDEKTKVITKTIYDTVFITTTYEKSKKKKAPSLDAWNTKARKKIESFVNEVTNPKSKNYVMPTDRIAVFDNEGTMWPEKPVYFQLEFMFDRIKAMAKDHPEWKKDKLIQAVLENNLKKIRKFGGEGLYKLSAITQSGMTTDTYSKMVKQWINTARHPTKKMLFKDMTYLPMVQLVRYLKHYDFKVFLVTEGGSGFMRPWIEEVYGIPKENIVASRRKLTLSEQNSKLVLIREPEIEFVNNYENKVISIGQQLGGKPVVAFGNSDGDLDMLRWSAERKGKSLVGIIHHTDAKREWAYDKDSKIGKLDKALKTAEKNHWFIVDMKNDWKKIYLN